MPRRFHAGHGMAVGVLVGLLLAQHVFIVALLAFALGLLLGRTWKGARAAVGKAGALIDARVGTERERGKAVRAARRRNLERARETRTEREERERKAYWRGAADGSR